MNLVPLKPSPGWLSWVSNILALWDTSATQNQGHFKVFNLYILLKQPFVCCTRWFSTLVGHLNCSINYVLDIWIFWTECSMTTKINWKWTLVWYKTQLQHYVNSYFFLNTFNCNVMSSWKCHTFLITLHCFLGAVFSKLTRRGVREEHKALTCTNVSSHFLQTSPAHHKAPWRSSKAPPHALRSSGGHRRTTGAHQWWATYWNGSRSEGTHGRSWEK